MHYCKNLARRPLFVVATTSWLVLSVRSQVGITERLKYMYTYVSVYGNQWAIAAPIVAIQPGNCPIIQNLEFLKQL